MEAGGEVPAVGLDSGKSTSVIIIPDPSSSVGALKTAGVLLLTTPSVVVTGVCIVVSISTILVNVPVRVGICEVVCTSVDDADTLISGVTLTVASAGVLGGTVLNTNVVVGVGVIDSRVNMVVSATEESETVSLSICVVGDTDPTEAKNGVAIVVEMVGCGVDMNAVSLRVDISVEKTKVANPVSLMEGRELLLVNCVVASVGEISSSNSVVDILTKDEETNGWVVGIISTSDASSDTDTAVSAVVKAGTVEDGTSNTIVPPTETDAETRDGETTPVMAELSSTVRL